MDETTLIERLEQNLERRGFKTHGGVGYGDFNFVLVGHQSKIELSKFGHIDYFVTVGKLEEPTLANIRSFSSQSYGYASQNRTSFLPPGFFAGFFVFPIILVDQISDSVIQAIENEDPPKHWASAEFPIVIEISSGKVRYYQRTPVWGRLYFAEFRRLAKELTSPNNHPPL